MSPHPSRWTLLRTPILRHLIGWLAGAILWIRRWRFEVDLPKHPKSVVVVAPHTSYWDAPVLLGAAFRFGVDAHWLGTHRLFRGPGKYLFRWLGGIAVDRSRTNGLVGAAVAAFDEREELLLGLAPEGTRFPAERWKSGFYRIAHGAGATIAMVSIDYSEKFVRIGGEFTPTGDADEDMKVIRAFYEGVEGHRPEWFTEPRL